MIESPIYQEIVEESKRESATTRDVGVRPRAKTRPDFPAVLERGTPTIAQSEKST